MTEVSQEQEDAMVRAFEKHIASSLAFPVPESWTHLGMNYREYLIGQAIQGSAHMIVMTPNDYKTELAETAVAIADEIIRQLARKK